MSDSTCIMQTFSSETHLDTKEGNPMRALGESISFGRYMTEPLDWERWSSFNNNRHLEEVEKYSRPGSVAQKKAYFEAHYKAIAERKAAAAAAEEAAASFAASNDVLEPEEQNIGMGSGGDMDLELDGLCNDVVVDEVEVFNADVECDIDANVCNSNYESCSFKTSKGEEVEPVIKEEILAEDCKQFQSPNQHEDVNNKRIDIGAEICIVKLIDKSALEESIPAILEPSKSATNGKPGASSLSSKALKNPSSAATPSTPVSSQRPSTSAYSRRPSNLVLPQRPSTPVQRQRPITPVQRPRPITPVQRPRPSTPVQRPRPIAPVQHLRPSTPVQLPRPIAPVQHLRPSTPVQPRRPSTHVQSRKPSILVQRPRPSTPVQRPAPGQPMRPNAPVQPRRPTTPVQPQRENNATPNNKNSARDAMDKNISTPKSLHMSINFTPSPSRAGEISKLSPPIFYKNRDSGVALIPNNTSKDSSTPLRPPSRASASVNGVPKPRPVTPQSGSKRPQMPPLGNTATASRKLDVNCQSVPIKSKAPLGNKAPASRKLDVKWQSLTIESKTPTVLASTKVDVKCQSLCIEHPSSSSSLSSSRNKAWSPVASSSFNFRTDERAAKRKEYFQRLEERFNAKEAQKMQLEAKSKEKDDNEVRKLRQSLSFKANPMPNFSMRQGQQRVLRTWNFGA